MTNTEAVEWIEALIETMHEETSGSWPDPEYRDEVYEALDMAIKSMKCGYILDKIRAEIESIELLAEYTRGDIKRMALDILDKYKAESEVEK